MSSTAANQGVRDPQAGRPGMVHLVGAGPGDPGLITLRGREALALADVVLYDYLASERLLEWTRPGADVACLGRHGHGKLWTQAEINARMVAEAQAGKRVVRLKGGDPSIFGRLGEELDALLEARIPFEIVPGVSAAVAAGAYAGVTITDRDAASCVTFVTGHENPAKGPPTLDFGALAALPGTLVFYMGVTTAADWSARLIAAGKSPETPVALVRRCSLPDQSTLTTTLGGVADRLVARALRPPLVAVIGPVALRGDAAEWFTGRPLFGQTVLVTRPAGQADATRDALDRLGAQTLCQPAIEIGPPPDAAALDAALDRLADYDWVVFSSRNGVEAVLDRHWRRGGDARGLARARLAAIGPATAEALAAWRLRCDLHPDDYRAESLAAALAPGAEDKRFLVVRASRGRDVLAPALRAAGALVDEVVAYDSRDVTAPDPEVAAALAGGAIDWVTVTSSAIARSLVAQFGEGLGRTRLAAISPLTAGVLAELGRPAAVVADEATSDSLIAAIARAVQRGA